MNRQYSVKYKWVDSYFLQIAAYLDMKGRADVALCLSDAPAAAWEKCACKQWLSSSGLRADPLERNDTDDPFTGEPDYQSELAANLRPGCFTATGTGSR